MCQTGVRLLLKDQNVITRWTWQKPLQKRNQPERDFFGEIGRMIPTEGETKHIDGQTMGESGLTSESQHLAGMVAPGFGRGWWAKVIPGPEFVPDEIAARSEISGDSAQGRDHLLLGAQVRKDEIGENEVEWLKFGQLGDVGDMVTNRWIELAGGLNRADRQVNTCYVFGLASDVEKPVQKPASATADIEDAASGQVKTTWGPGQIVKDPGHGLIAPKVAVKPYRVQPTINAAVGVIRLIVAVLDSILIGFHHRILALWY